MGSFRKNIKYGSFSEKRLFARRINWIGIADLINISNQSVEIVEFKTGAYTEGHIFQLKVYCLLWYLDTKLNPASRLVNKLTLLYPQGRIDIPTLSLNGLTALEEELKERCSKATLAVSGGEPKARLGDGCNKCTVRHLCNDYWEHDMWLISPGLGTSEKKFIDIEATITGIHGIKSWDATISSMSDIGKEKRALIRTSSSKFEFKAGDRIRILSAEYIPSETYQSQGVIVSLNNFSEAFWN